MHYKVPGKRRRTEYVDLRGFVSLSVVLPDDSESFAVLGLSGGHSISIPVEQVPALLRALSIKVEEPK
jgi:hypothetical protein